MHVYKEKESQTIRLLHAHGRAAACRAKLCTHSMEISQFCTSYPSASFLVALQSAFNTVNSSAFFLWDLPFVYCGTALTFLP